MNALSKAPHCILALINGIAMASGFDHLAKGVSYFDEVTDNVKHFCIDADSSGSSTEKVADAIQNAFIELLDDNMKPFTSQTTDSGGVLDDLRNKLNTRGLIDDLLTIPLTLFAPVAFMQ